MLASRKKRAESLEKRKMGWASSLPWVRIERPIIHGRLCEQPPDSFANPCSPTALGPAKRQSRKAPWGLHGFRFARGLGVWKPRKPQGASQKEELAARGTGGKAR